MGMGVEWKKCRYKRRVKEKKRVKSAIFDLQVPWTPRKLTYHCVCNFFFNGTHTHSLSLSFNIHTKLISSPCFCFCKLQVFKQDKNSVT